jgi:flagellar hook-basal body complex protein FliE
VTAPIGAISGVSPVLAPAATGTAGAAGSGGANFAATLSRGLESLQGTQTKSDNLAVKAATGDLQDAHDYMIASSEASLAMQLTTAVRNKALDAFNEIMRMQA